MFKIRWMFLNIKYWWVKVKFVYRYNYERAMYGEEAATLFLLHATRELEKQNNGKQILREIEEMIK